MQTDCGSEIAVLLWTRVTGQDPWTDVDWKFQDPHVEIPNNISVVKGVTKNKPSFGCGLSCYSSGCGHTVPIVTTQSPVPQFSAAPATVDDAFLNCSHDDNYFLINCLQLFHFIITYNDEYRDLQRDVALIDDALCHVIINSKSPCWHTESSTATHQWRINHDANDAMAWGPPLKGAPRAAVWF